MSASQTAAEKWSLIKSQGARSSAYSDPVSSLPALADHQLIDKYQQYGQRCIASLVTSAASGLWMLLQIPEIFVPLLATKKSESIPCLFLR